MKVRGDERCAHDLWTIDERLTFAKYFASDLPFSQIVEGSISTERMDLCVFDRLHGLGSEEPLRRIMLVEFKKPGRTDYDAATALKAEVAVPCFFPLCGRPEQIEAQLPLIDGGNPSRLAAIVRDRYRRQIPMHGEG